MKLTPVEHLPFLTALYSSYIILGPLETLRHIPYFTLTSKSDATRVLFMSYAHGVLTNSRRSLLRHNQKADFKDGNPSNINKSNLKSVVVKDIPPPMLGWGLFSTLEALEAASSAKEIPQKMPVLGPSAPITPSINRVAPSILPCVCCGLPLALTRFQKYRYSARGISEFFHNECRKKYLDIIRKRGLKVRQRNAEERNASETLSLRLTHYSAKKPMSAAEASAHGPEYFEANYHKVGKDYLPQFILKRTIEPIHFGATERTIVPLIKEWLSITDTLYNIQSGPNFILFKRSGTLKDAPKEFIHASW